MHSVAPNPNHRPANECGSARIAVRVSIRIATQFMRASMYWANGGRNVYPASCVVDVATNYRCTHECSSTYRRLVLLLFCGEAMYARSTARQPTAFHRHCRLGGVWGNIPVMKKSKDTFCKGYLCRHPNVVNTKLNDLERQPM